MIHFDAAWWAGATLLAGAILTALLLAVGHWFNWPHRLDRVQAYVYGVAAILTGFCVWRLLNGDWQTPAGLAVIAGAGGATVMGAYRVDALVLAWRQARRAHEHGGPNDG